MWGCVAHLAHSAEKSLRHNIDVHRPTDTERLSRYLFHIALALLSGRVMSFQITVLKVLAGHPGGRASVADLRQAVAILISSGSDWTNRTKRLAALAPGLDISSQSFVLRDEEGWQITDRGRAFLASVESPVQRTAENEKPPETITTPVPSPESPPIRLVAVKASVPSVARATGCALPAVA
jgi:hypothetical protein